MSEVEKREIISKLPTCYRKCQGFCHHPLYSNYRESLDSAVSNSAVPDLVRFQNRTKLSKFPDTYSAVFSRKIANFCTKMEQNWSKHKGPRLVRIFETAL